MNKKLIKLNHILLSILLVVQPFVIMFQTMVVRDIQLFGLSVFEGFNIGISGLCVCLTIWTHSDKKVFLKYIPYVIALGGYFIAHGYNIYLFNNGVYEAQSPSFLVESYYLVRTFLVPLFVVFSIYYSGMTKERVLKILDVVMFVIVFVMAVTNLFGVALQNYGEETVEAAYRLFDWFTFQNPYEYSYYELTTRGWFLSGNQMSAVLFMTFPIVLYRAYKLRDLFHYSTMILQMLAMFMLGTKVANAGCILIFFLFLGVWVLFALLKQDRKSNLPFAVILTVFVVLLPFSPLGYKYRYTEATGEVHEDGLLIDEAMDIELDTVDDSLKEYYENFIEDSVIFKNLDPENLSEHDKLFVKNYTAIYGTFFGINEYITDNYNDLDHSVFWAHYLQETPSNDYRVLKTMILKDIYEKNNNPYDKYLGMGYTLNYIYTEADYTHQYYSYGILGLLLLIGPYFVMIGYVLLQGLRHFRKMFTLNCAMYFFAPTLGLCVAKFSGHVLERGFPLLMIGLTMGILLLHTKETISPERMVEHEK